MKAANLDTMQTTNVSLVAFYGDKPTELSNLITRLQTYLANHRLFGDQFIPYQLEQVHGTIIGCEGLRKNQEVVSQWFMEKRQSTRYINFSGLIDYLQHQLDFPITIRFGGYKPQIDYKFLSRNQHLGDRSFQLQSASNQTIPIVIGWSWQDHAVTLAVDNLRRSLQQFNLLHKYHETPSAIDNDFYLRLGTINAQLTSSDIDAITSELRNLLATSDLVIPLDLDNLAFVQYQDLSLTPSTTKVISVSEISPNELKELYPQQG